MALVEIPAVQLADLDTEHLLGRHIDLPKPAHRTEVYALVVRGWVVGRTSPAAAVELVHQDVVVRRTPVQIHRPDLGALYTGVEAAAHGGFETTLNLLGVEPEAEVLVRAVLESGRRVPLATLHVRRRRLATGFEPGLRPLLLTTSGRSGSTWVTHLLDQHPHVFAYRAFQYEPRAATYWVEILKTLSEPASYRQAIMAELSAGPWWIGDRRTAPLPPVVDPAVERWLGRGSIEALAAFCQQQIESCYTQAAAVQERADARYFVEKCVPTHHVPSLVWELYPDAREIILVRDFRDVVCSVVSFNRKHDQPQFYRGRVREERDYIREVRRDAARLLESWRARSERSYLLRYEDVIQRPEEVLPSLLAYLGVDADLQTARRMIRQATDRIPEAQRSHQTSGSPAASIGRWRRDMDASWQAASREAFEDIMQALGYAYDAPPPSPPQPALRQA